MIFLNLYLLLSYNQYLQRCIWSCETTLHPSSLLTFIIRNFRSDLTPLQRTFRGNTRSCFSRTARDISKYDIFLLYDKYCQRYSWSCKKALHPPSLIPFTISNIGSALTPHQLTSGVNNRSRFSIPASDISKSAFFVSIRSIASKIQLILWKRPPFILNLFVHFYKISINSNSVSNKIKV